mgnify:CR=1 FL=1
MDYNYTFDNNIYNNSPMVLDNNTSYEYIIDNLDNKSMCNVEISPDILKINEIKNKIINILNDSDINASDTQCENQEITKLCDSYDKFKNDYKNEQEKYLLSEKNLNEAIKKIQSDLKKLDLIVKFMNEIGENNCKDQLNETIISNLKEFSKNIEDNEDIITTKKEYIINKTNINKYLEFIKKINHMNISNICPLCLTNCVSVYLNPCGHTCCDDCYNRICENNNKCFLCRNRILNKNPLYFS